MNIAGLMGNSRAGIAQITVALDAMIAWSRAQRILNPDPAAMATAERPHMSDRALSKGGRIKPHSFRSRGWNSGARAMVNHQLALVCFL